MEKHDEVYQETLEYLSQYSIEKLIQLIDARIRERDTVLKEAMLFNETLSQLERQIRELEERLQVLEIIIEGLSPKNGLIGKVVIPKINAILEAVNAKIRTVWSYPLEIILIDENEITSLDYRFKVRVNNTEIIPDIKNMSSAMREIVDLAFRLVVLGYMRLDIPLYLDEFGKSMDTIHRARVYQMIAQSAQTSPWSQVFIVSHFSSAYGSLTDVDYVVLSTDNVDPPDGYNDPSIVQIQ